jgi:hypothetical protein
LKKISFLQFAPETLKYAGSASTQHCINIKFNGGDFSTDKIINSLSDNVKLTDAANVTPLLGQSALPAVMIAP